MKKLFKNKDKVIQLVLLLAIIVAVNIVGNYVFKRFDLTKEGRFTLSEPTKKLVKEVNNAIVFRVYLEGEFPAGFKRLRSATRDMLVEFRSINSNIQFEFIDPIAGDLTSKEKQKIQEELIAKGLFPTNLKTQNEDGASSKIIFPGVIINYQGREAAIQLLEDQVGLGPEQVLNNSISLLENKLATALSKVVNPIKPAIGFIEGHGELDTLETASIREELSKKYVVKQVNLPSQTDIPTSFKVIVIAKPKTEIPDRDKFKLDQFVMNGGRILWMIDRMDAHLDSLKGKSAYVPRDYPLNIEDQLFKYGVRINPNLVQDLICSKIPLVVGNIGNKPQTELFPWYYHPVLLSRSNHPIVNNIDGISSEFVSSIDTVGNNPNIKKTVLLTSGEYSKVQFNPMRLHFGVLQYKPDPKQYNKPFQPVAVLLEGKFASLYKNKLSPQTLSMLDSLKQKFIPESNERAKMIVVSDGDIIANAVNRRTGSILPIGFNKFTQQTFANKIFILNAIEYLMDDTGLMITRSKDLKIRLLDMEKVKVEKQKWQFVNILVPMILLMIFGAAFYFIRRKIYT